MSSSTSVATNGGQRSGPIRRDAAPADRHPAAPAPPAQRATSTSASSLASAATATAPSVSPAASPAAAPRPRLMWLVLGLSSALVSLLVARALVQAAAIDRYLTDSGSVQVDVAGMTAESAGWIIDTSFVIATACLAMALYTISGSRVGRAIFTALLAAGTLLGLWGAVAPQSAAVGGGELILADAHPAFTSLTSLAVALIGIALLVILYRPAVTAYVRGHSAPAAP